MFGTSQPVMRYVRSGLAIEKPAWKFAVHHFESCNELPCTNCTTAGRCVCAHSSAPIGSAAFNRSTGIVPAFSKACNCCRCTAAAGSNTSSRYLKSTWLSGSVHICCARVCLHPEPRQCPFRSKPSSSSRFKGVVIRVAARVHFQYFVVGAFARTTWQVLHTRACASRQQRDTATQPKELLQRSVARRGHPPPSIVPARADVPTANHQRYRLR